MCNKNLLFLLLTGCCLSAATWTPASMMRVKPVGAVLPSPDGKWAIWTESRALMEGEKSEMLVQVGLYVQALTQMVTACGREGQLELNTTLPLMAYGLHESIHCLARGAQVFAERCVTGLEADVARCRELMERSLMLVTALNPHIGYDAAASVAKEAFATGKSLREIVLARGLMDAATLDHALEPLAMTKPGESSLAGGG
ncbi:MAG: hypothetical protein J0M20_17550 [Burkholderiales bacterium]|nr:hypothetical protein [Burkholderiales bacterium]